MIYKASHKGLLTFVFNASFFLLLTMVIFAGQSAYGMEEKNEFLWGFSGREGYKVHKGRRVRRHPFEDRYSVQPKNSFFALFDGHGGIHAAEYAQKNLWHEFNLNLSTNPLEVREAFKNAFINIDAQLHDEYKKNKKYKSGTTAIAAYLNDDHQLFIAWVGDSRGIIIRNNTLLLATTDHKPDAERIRLEEAINNFNKEHGNKINPQEIIAKSKDKQGKENGPLRVLGLAVSRSLGDAERKEEENGLGEKLIIAEPEIKSIGLHSGDIIVFASDGFWDVIDNQEAIKLITKAMDAIQGKTNSKASIRNTLLGKAKLDLDQVRGGVEHGNETNERLTLIARALMNAAYNAKSKDDISVLLIEYVGE